MKEGRWPAEELLVASVCGGPISAAKALAAKDVGIYAYELQPTPSVAATFKKSSTECNCLAVSETHVFAAQKDKAYVHVYSRLRGNQEAAMAFPERIRSLALQDDVLLLGTAEGRLLLWEVCTGRQVSVAPRHVQAVSCIAATEHHVLTGSEDSSVHVWSLPKLLELDAPADGHEPLRSLSGHRAAVAAVAVGPGNSRDARVCATVAADKTCLLWNYHTGELLRTLLFPTAPLCIALDPCLRALAVSCAGGPLFVVELFGEKPLLGARSAEAAATVVQVADAFASPPPDAGGAATCLALGPDGLALFSGHPLGHVLQWNVMDGDDQPTLVADLNAAVTNLSFVSPAEGGKNTRALTIVRPSHAERKYAFAAQFDRDLGAETRFGKLLTSTGVDQAELERAILAFQEPPAESEGDAALRSQLDEVWELLNQQRALQKQTQQLYLEAKGERPSK